MPSLMRTLGWLCCVAALAACTTTNTPPGADLVGRDKTELLRRMGQPMRITPLDGGERWDYSRGPDGLNTYFIYLDGEGRISRYEQVMSEANFSRIKPGMTRDEVILILGDPPKRLRLARERGDVWSYRYFTTICIWFQIEFTPEDRVRSTGYNRRPTGIPCR